MRWILARERQHVHRFRSSRIPCNSRDIGPPAALRTGGVVRVAVMDADVHTRVDDLLLCLGQLTQKAFVCIVHYMVNYKNSHAKKAQ